MYVVETFKFIYVQINRTNVKHLIYDLINHRGYTFESYFLCRLHPFNLKFEQNPYACLAIQRSE